MATDPARIYIDAVETRYAVLFPTDPPAFKIGWLAFDEHDAPPIVKFGFGDLEDDDAIGGETIGTETQELVVQIWGKGTSADQATAQDEAEASVRTIRRRLLLACRDVAMAGGGLVPDEPLELGRRHRSRWRWTREAHEHHGRMLTGSIWIRMTVPPEIFQTVKIESVQVTEKADYDGDGTPDETLDTHTAPAP